MPRQKPDSAKPSSAELAGKFGMSPRTLRDVMQKAGVSTDDFEGVALAVVAWLRKRAEDAEAETADAADKKRKARAEANMAEMEEQKMAGKLVDIEVARQRLTQIVVESREKIRKADFLTKDQKSKVCQILAGL